MEEALVMEIPVCFLCRTRHRVQFQRPGFPGGRGESVQGAAGPLGHL